MIRFCETISAAKTLGPGQVPDGKARHQIAVADGVGTLEVRINFGAGLTSMTTIDASEDQRAPYCVEAEVDQIEFVPSENIHVCYRAEKV
jgi:hypothetical protein